MDRDPPHWLKPLKRTLMPKRLAFMYCATGVDIGSEGNSYKWTAGCLITTHWSRRKNERVDATHHAETPEQLWEAVTRFCPPGRRTVLWCYDLSEQVRVSDLFTVMTGKGWHVDKLVLEPNVGWMLLRNGKRSLMICDLKAWTPTEWKRLRKLVKHGHTPSGRNRSNHGAADTLSHTHVRELQTLVMDMLGWLETQDAGSFRPTGSGQSYACYRKRFLSHRLLVHDNMPALAAERQAMHAGRAEAWRHGKLYGGPFLEMDMRTAYTRIAATCDVPTVLRGPLYRPTFARVLQASQRERVLIDVTCSLESPCIPFRGEHRTYWPVGRFRTVLWDSEFSLLPDTASDVVVHHAWRYSRAPALQEFSTWVMDQLDSGQIDGPPIAAHVLKHWSRTLVGRFGLRYRSWDAFGDHPKDELRLVTYSDLIDGLTTDMLIVGRDRFVLTDMLEGGESMPQIPGWIMSECRRRLWVTMNEIGLDAVCYVDTDSIIVDLSRTDATAEEIIQRYGEWWAPKRTWNRLTIYGPRNIRLDDNRRISGVPSTARQTGELEFSGEVLKSVRHSLASGRLDQVERVPRRFHLKTPDMRRLHNADGSTSPFRIEEECIQGIAA